MKKISPLLLLLFLASCTDSTKQKKSIATKQKAQPIKRVVTKEEKIKELSKGLNKSVETMSITELRRAKEFALLTDNKQAAIKIIDRMIIVSTDQQEIAQLHLERANLNFDLGRFQKAGKQYEEYLKMYPGSEKIDEVKYKAILCRFYQTLDVDRDQSKTKNTLALANEYLKQPELFITYQADVKDIQKKCCKKLLESEMYVFNFYLKRGNTKAAQIRLDFMKEHYLPAVPEVEPQLLTLEYDLATRRGDLKLAQEKQEELARKQPQQTVTVATHKKPDYVKKF